VLADLTRPWAVVKREQWQVAARIDGRTTVRELAWRYGLAVHETIERVGELARGGLCALLPPVQAVTVPNGDVAGAALAADKVQTAAARLATAELMPTGPATAEVATAEVATAEVAAVVPAAVVPETSALPARQRGATMRTAPVTVAHISEPVPETGPPRAWHAHDHHPDLLRRVLDGLRRLGLTHGGPPHGSWLLCGGPPRGASPSRRVGLPAAAAP